MSDTCDRSPYCYGDTELFAEIERLKRVWHPAENEVLREQNLAINKTVERLRKALESILVLCVEGVEVMDCVKIVWAVEKIAAEALKRGNDD